MAPVYFCSKIAVKSYGSGSSQKIREKPLIKQCQSLVFLNQTKIAKDILGIHSKCSDQCRWHWRCLPESNDCACFFIQAYRRARAEFLIDSQLIAGEHRTKRERRLRRRFFDFLIFPSAKIHAKALVIWKLARLFYVYLNEIPLAHITTYRNGPVTSDRLVLKNRRMLALKHLEIIELWLWF